MIFEISFFLNNYLYLQKFKTNLMKKYATLKDIANALRVSTATVSRALADKWDVNAETKRIVCEEAKRQNYKPNPIAKRLQNRHSKTIGLVIPEFRSSFFSNVIAGVQKIIDEAGYQLLITQSQESMDIELRNLKLLENNMVEGIIISVTSEGENLDYYQELIDGGIPIVFFNRAPSKILAPKVIIDDYKLAFFDTEHLIYNGFKKIYHFSGPTNLAVSKERKRGFIDAMKKHHREITENSIIPAGIFSDKGYGDMLSLIRKNDIPDAIFCFNDPTALGALKALKEEGLQCPNDVALVGFSESELAQLVEPPLTSIEQPTFEMGETAARLVISQIMQTPPPEPETICLIAKLNVRKSSINVKR